MRIQQSVDIEAPPERIWPFFVEPEKILKWCITFQKFEYTGEQRSVVGTPLYIEEMATGPVMKLSFEVSGWVDNQRLAVADHPPGDPLVCRELQAFHLLFLGAGGTGDLKVLPAAVQQDHRTALGFHQLARGLLDKAQYLLDIKAGGDFPAGVGNRLNLGTFLIELCS